MKFFFTTFYMDNAYLNQSLINTTYDIINQVIS